MNPDLITDKLSPELTSLLSQNNVLLVIAIFALMTTMKAVLAGQLVTSVGQRLLPILPLVLGILGAFCGCSDADIEP